jgi:hypothetical protein
VQDVDEAADGAAPGVPGGQDGPAVRAAE